MRFVILLACLLGVSTSVLGFEPWPKIEDDDFEKSNEYKQLEEEFKLLVAAGEDYLANPYTAEYVDVPRRSYGRTKLVQAKLSVYGPWRTKGAHPAVLYFAPRSTAWGDCLEAQAWTKMLNLRELVAGLNARGILFISVEYPPAEYPLTWQCGVALLDWLRMHAADINLDTNRLGAMGYDQGGHLAAMLALALPSDANRPRVRAVCAGGTPWDLVDLGSRYAEVHNLGKPRAEVEEFVLRGIVGTLPSDANERRAFLARHSPIRHISPDDPPFFVFHVPRDYIYSFSQAERFVGKMHAAGAASELYSADFVASKYEGLHFSYGSRYRQCLSNCIEHFERNLGGTTPEAALAKGQAVLDERERQRVLAKERKREISKWPTQIDLARKWTTSIASPSESQSEEHVVMSISAAEVREQVEKARQTGLINERQAFKPVALHAEIGIPYRDVDGVTLHLDVYCPSEVRPHPVVVILGERASSHRQVKGRSVAAQTLPGLTSGDRAAVVTVQYREPGAHWKVTDTCEDLRAALRWIDEHGEQFGFDTTRIGGLGICEGATAMFGVALMQPYRVGDRADPSTPSLKVIACIGIRMSQENARGLTKSVRREMPPVYWVHSDQDQKTPTTVPAILDQSLRAAGSESELLIVRGGKLLKYPIILNSTPDLLTLCRWTESALLSQLTAKEQ